MVGSSSEGYTYDNNGNRTGGGYSTIAGNRLMSDGTYNYEYDAEGNRTKRTLIADNTVEEYRWDYRNRLTEIVTKNASGSVLKTVDYEYDVDDQRVKKTVTSTTPSAGDGVENYFIDRDQIAFVTDASGDRAFHYLYGLNVDAVMAQDSPVGMVWSLADRLGSIETLTDGDGNVVNQRKFDSFGRVLDETNPSVSFRYGYTGRERDLESGLDYYRARYYDPQVGRFISVDPMGFEAGDTNLYRYVGNSSTNYTDPTGEIGQIAGGAIGGAIFGGLYALAKDWEEHKEFNWDTVGNVLRGAAVGALYGIAFTSGLAAVAQIGGTASALATGTVANAYFTSEGLKSGINNIFYQNRPWTGALDLIGAGFGIAGLYRSPGGGGNGPKSGGATALAYATEMASSLSLAGSSGFAGQKAGELFQHFFAATSNLNGNKNGWDKELEQAEETIEIGGETLPKRKKIIDPETKAEREAPTHGILVSSDGQNKVQVRSGGTWWFKGNQKKWRKNEEKKLLEELRQQGVDESIISDIQVSLTHAEGNAALFMRSRSKRIDKPVEEATLNINHNKPCPYCVNPDPTKPKAIEYILAPGQRMLVKSVEYPEGQLYEGKKYK